MPNENSGVPSTAVPFSEAVRRYATSPLRASLPGPFPGAGAFMNHFPRGLTVAEREAMACLRRDLARGVVTSWGRAGSPYNPLSPIPAEAWQHLRQIDWSQEKFGISRDQPETFIWNVRVKLLATVDEAINDFDYFNRAADALALLSGLPPEHAETAVLSAVYLGHSSVCGTCATGPEIQTGDPFWTAGEGHTLNAGGPGTDRASVHQVPHVRLAVWERDRLVPYRKPIARPGDIAVSLSRIIPAYDKMEDSEDFRLQLAFARIEEVLINIADFFAFCRHDGTLQESDPVLATGSRKSTIAANTRCGIWLFALMSAGEPTKTKHGYFLEAQERYPSVSRRGFNHGWAEAAKASGDEMWTKPGPKGRDARRRSSR